MRLFDSIASHFGKDRVFIDVDSIEAGSDFSAVISDRLARCDVFLALIGRSWVRATDEQGNRRLDDPGDFVRMEIAKALSLPMRIVPVLLGGAHMPSAHQLLADLRPLLAHNAHEIPDRFFEQSVRQLIAELQSSVRPEGWTHAVSRRTMVLAGSVSSVLAGGGLLSALYFSKTTTRADTPTRTGAGRGGEAPGPDIPRLKIPELKPNLPVILREPQKVAGMPREVAGAWVIDKVSFTKEVSGPAKQPHLLWASPESFEPVGWAPDETAYVRAWDEFSGFRQGRKIWGYHVDFDDWTFQGVMSDGRAWLRGSRGLYCFNSLGEGGWLEGLKAIPHHLIRPAAVSEDTSNCSTAGIRRTGLAAEKPLPLAGGNCLWAMKDGTGKLYAATDRGTVYCLATNGSILWKFEAGTPPPPQPLYSFGDLIFHPSDRLYCVREGVLRWTLPLKDCAPTLVDKSGTIYLSYTEKVPNYNFNPPHLFEEKLTAAVDRDGHLLWRLGFLFSRLMQAVFLDPQGRLYLQGEGVLLCLSS